MSTVRPIVGRAAELAAASACYARAAAGLPQVLLVCGEAGIGKTRLVAEICTRARTSAVLLICERGN